MAAQMCKKRKVLPPIKHKLIWLQTERASRGTPALKLGSPERARDAIGFLDLSWRVEQQDASGKLRAQRAKSMKFKDGYMISSGQPVIEYIDSALRHVLLRQDVLGIEVKIVLDLDPNFPRVSNAPRHPYLIWSPFTNPRRKGT